MKEKSKIYLIPYVNVDKMYVQMNLNPKSIAFLTSGRHSNLTAVFLFGFIT
jgi:hypothetical protein